MPVVQGFIAGQPVLVRLSAAARTALGVPDTEIQLYAANTVDGWLRADYREANGDITRYFLPPESVLYLKQLQPQSNPSQPQ